jgi:LuxR family transcriptional regulator of spore coat protein
MGKLFIFLTNRWIRVTNRIAQRDRKREVEEDMHWGRQEDPPVLTEREQEILRCVAMGFSSKEIAQKLGIAPRTVDRHIENIRHKLRARNKTHMVAKALASGQLLPKARKKAVQH